MQVKLVYFKPSGKYYSEGEYQVADDIALHTVWDQVRAMMQQQTLPGLIQGHSNFMVSVDVPGHMHEHPHIIMPTGAW